jgi:hypothetical protein
MVDIAAADIASEWWRANLVRMWRTLAVLVLLGFTFVLVSDLSRQDGGCYQSNVSSDYACDFF